FQACLYFAAVFQATSCGIHYLASVFLVETPKFLCDTPWNITDVLYGNHSASSLEEIWSFYTPGKGPVVVRTVNGEQWELGPCRKMLRRYTQDFQYEFIGNKSLESCSSYVFDHSQVEQSIVTEWDLVCEKEWLAKLTQPTFMLGVLIGALLFGDIADRVGRRPILMATSVCQFAFGVTVAFTGNYYTFMVMRFLLAMVSSGYLVVVFVYVTEFTGSKVRTWTSMHVHAAFAIGVMVVALVGYLIRVWWLYQIILTLSTSPVLLYCWKFPETPFYLMAKGQHREAQELLDTMARWNGLERRVKVSELIEQSGNAFLEDKQSSGDIRLEEPEKKLSILNMFGSWKMAGRSATCWAIWFIGSLGYYVFSLGSVNLGGNQYINLFLA
ncbi:solute carrier family 22 member 16, partial [Tachysurus ichikawai]